MGWAATEAGEFKAAHNWYEESVRRADAEENDVLRATGRIELAGSKLFGFGPDAYAEFAARGEDDDLCFSVCLFPQPPPPPRPTHPQVGRQCQWGSRPRREVDPKGRW